LRFRVRSSDGTKAYEVVADVDGWSCECPEWLDRKTPCKHILETVIWLDPNPPPLHEQAVEPSKPTYTQPDWGAYDRGQQLEHEVFDRYLWDLVGGLHETPWPRAKRGRPVIPLRTQVMMAVRKVHLNQSTRRARGLLVALNQDGKGLLARVPNYSVPSRFFNRPLAAQVLVELIERSGLVLRDIEDAGTVAIDSSGFSTSTMGSYFTEKYAPERRHGFVKAHLAVGVKSHIVLAVRVTDEHRGDSPQFLPLLRRLSDVGHTPHRVAADKAYLSRENLTGADSLGIEPFIPFKVNSRGLARGSPMWNRKYHEFQLRRDEFDAAYHQRSNVESTFSAIKRKLGEPLLSKTTFARLNELLAKILAYNVGVVISQAQLHGLEPSPTNFIPRLPSLTQPAETAS
jgi:transposase